MNKCEHRHVQYEQVRVQVCTSKLGVDGDMQCAGGDK